MQSGVVWHSTSSSRLYYEFLQVHVLFQKVKIITGIHHTILVEGQKHATGINNTNPRRSMSFNAFTPLYLSHRLIGSKDYEWQGTMSAVLYYYDSLVELASCSALLNLWSLLWWVGCLCGRINHCLLSWCWMSEKRLTHSKSLTII